MRVFAARKRATLQLGKPLADQHMDFMFQSLTGGVATMIESRALLYASVLHLVAASFKGQVLDCRSWSAKSSADAKRAFVLQYNQYDTCSRTLPLFFHPSGFIRYRPCLDLRERVSVQSIRSIQGAHGGA